MKEATTSLAPFFPRTEMNRLEKIEFLGVSVSLSPLVWSILERLGSHAASSELEIGGGIALWHYIPHRQTNDIDAWWAQESPAAAAAIQETMMAAALEHDLSLLHRNQSAYQSWDLKKNGKTFFAFQIARKTNRVEPPGPAKWGSLRMETLPENLANKMSALAQRGAPRDILDIATVLKAGLISPQTCWELWQRKHPEVEVKIAQANVLKYLNALAARKPLQTIADQEQRAQASENREIIRCLASLGVQRAAGL